MATFQTKPEKVTARQLTRSNIKSIAKWVGASRYVETVDLSVPDMSITFHVVDCMPFSAVFGWWVIKTPTRVFAINDTDFHNTYDFVSEKEE